MNWIGGISLANEIPGSSPLRIDARSGLLSVTPDRVGLFVFSVEVGEYRNKKFIGVVRRDYQVLVIDCAKNDPLNFFFVPMPRKPFIRREP